MGAKRSPTLKLAKDGTVERRIPRSQLSSDEQARICHWVSDGIKPVEIAKRLKRSTSAIYNFLGKVRNDKAFGRMFLDSNVQFVAKRLIEEATPSELLEILDRNGVLPKKQREAVQQGPSVIVAVGMPGQPAMIAPTQADVTKAISQANAPPVALPMPTQGVKLTAPVIDVKELL